jgi:hypothetical protein
MDRDRIKARISEIAKRPNHVRFEELKTLLENHIGPLFSDFNHHGNPHHAFTVGGETFTIAQPKKSPFIKRPYIRKFLDAMEAVGLYNREGNNEGS